MTGPASPARPTTKPAGVIRLFRTAGVQWYLSTSWVWGLLLFGVLIYSQLNTGLEARLIWIMGITMFVSLIVGVIIHESVHAVAARAAGYDVKSITLTLWGGHTVYSTLRPRPLPVALVAVAGPTSNLLIAGIAAWAAGVVRDPTIDLVLLVIQWINLILGIFNLLPGLPMDGGQVVSSIGWAISGSRATGMIAGGWAGRVVALGIALYYLWPLVQGRAIADSLLLNIWMLLVVFFLFMNASSVISSAKARRELESVTVAEASLPAIVVDGGLRLRDAYQMAPRPDQALLVRDASGAVTGAVAPQAITAQDAERPVASFATGCPATPIDLTPDEPVADVMVAMLSDSIPAVPVRYPTGEPRLLNQASIGAALARHRIAAR